MVSSSSRSSLSSWSFFWIRVIILEFFCAAFSGVRPYLSSAFGSAPLSSNTAATSRLSHWTAISRGVAPVLSRMLTIFET